MTANELVIHRSDLILLVCFKVSTEYYQVENGNDWGRLGDTDEYFWETPEEKKKKK